MNNRKGFTLAELLIVVAIIAVLVGISIPVFNDQLEKSRDAVSLANMRTAYAKATTAYLTGEGGDGVTINEYGYVIVEGVELKGRKKNNFGIDVSTLPFTFFGGNEENELDSGTYTMLFDFYSFADSVGVVASLY